MHYTNMPDAYYKHVGNENTIHLKWYRIHMYFCTPLLMSPHEHPNRMRQDKKLYMLTDRCGGPVRVDSTQLSSATKKVGLQKCLTRKPPVAQCLIVNHNQRPVAQC